MKQYLKAIFCTTRMSLYTRGIQEVMRHSTKKML